MLLCQHFLTKEVLGPIARVLIEECSLAETEYAFQCKRAIGVYFLVLSEYTFHVGTSSAKVSHMGFPPSGLPGRQLRLTLALSVEALARLSKPNLFFKIETVSQHVELSRSARRRG